MNESPPCCSGIWAGKTKPFGNDAPIWRGNGVLRACKTVPIPGKTVPIPGKTVPIPGKTVPIPEKTVLRTEKCVIGQERLFLSLFYSELR